MSASVPLMTSRPVLETLSFMSLTRTLTLILLVITNFSVTRPRDGIRQRGAVGHHGHSGGILQRLPWPKGHGNALDGKGAG